MTGTMGNGEVVTGFSIYYMSHRLFFCIVTMGFDELDQLFDCLGFGNISLYTFFLLIKADFAAAGAT